MSELNIPWVIVPQIQPPLDFITALKQLDSRLEHLAGNYAAQLLWYRGIQTPEQLIEFLHPSSYQPSSPSAFGQEMNLAVERLQQARNQGEKVAIWGDFDADGITSTAVLWEGLGQFFSREQHQLIYYIPNRLTESHGLNQKGITQLAQQQINLIVTCDTGSTNLAEIDYAQSLGIDIIVTDHHSLPPQRPPVVSIINPRYLAKNHPLFHLSGVAVAYKLIEALYQALPEIPEQPVTDLLDLVAIGLITDLVELKGDCRYLAKTGIKALSAYRKQLPEERRRPGIGYLLDTCKKNGDRPTDISFGIGPRINAVSRIYGAASFCVELLTSRDFQKCYDLALMAENANARRKELQKQITEDVTQKLSEIDLSTTHVIVLEDSQWPPGILGLVASQIAQNYHRPTILLSTQTEDLTGNSPKLARGSARSVGKIDLYQLVQSQEHLLSQFGGHPFAAGLSLRVDNLPLFTEAINQKLSQSEILFQGAISQQIDLVVTVAELGKELFDEMRVLEPYGMGNPTPKLLIENGWFEQVKHENLSDKSKRKMRYIKTDFYLCDESNRRGIKGVWWEHRQEEIPLGRCDAIAELDYNTHKNHYQLRLIAVRPHTVSPVTQQSVQPFPTQFEIIDWRNGIQTPLEDSTVPLVLKTCPNDWKDIQIPLKTAIQYQQPLVLAYPLPTVEAPQQVWQKLLGIAKYLNRTGEEATLQQIQDKLELSEIVVRLGLEAIANFGFTILYLNHEQTTLKLQASSSPNSPNLEPLQQFLAAIQEEQFRRQYFHQVSIPILKAIAQEINPIAALN